MYQRTWTASSGWTTTWANLGGQITSTPTVAHIEYALEVYARFTNGYLMMKEYYKGPDGVFKWWNWQGGSMDGPPGIL
jgi:hypothetical protein